MLTSLLGLTLLAAQPFNFYSHGPYDSTVPRPESILGYGPGERESTYFNQQEVVKAIAAAAKGRVVYIPYGKSTEGRPLRVLAISTPENIRRLEQIRKDVGELASGKSPREDEIIAGTPAIAWINECIHGNEPASFESAMWLLYNLAASREPAIEKLLQNCVVILNPSYNPDGHERFVVWYNSVATGSDSPEAFEQREPAIFNGRLNHYRFDMNRDRVAMSQAETRQEVAEFLRWHPQAYADQHGEVSTYFFPPASLSVNANVDRARYNKWADVFGHATGDAFDEQGFPYFVKDVFDLYYPGYLDSWTTLNGAIGMTHETDGGHSLSNPRRDGSVESLRGAMARHFTSALAVIQATSENHADLLRSFAAYRREAVEKTEIGNATYVVVHSAEQEEIDRIADLLASEQIEFQRLPPAFNMPGGLSLWGDHSTSVAGGASLLVPLRQAQGHLVKSLLECDTEFEPDFIKEQLRRHAQAEAAEKYPSADPAEFYDFTGWNLAFSHNLDAWYTNAPPAEADWKPRNAKRKDSVGYIIRPSERGDLVVADLLGRDVKVEVASKAIREGDGHDYPPGSFIIFRDHNEGDLDEAVRAVEHQRTPEGEPAVVEPLGTSYPETSDRQGAGSETVEPVAHCSIGVLFGDESSPTNFGAIWFALEHQFKLPFTPITRGSLSGDLSGYSCLIFPQGRTEPSSDKLKQWINDGGCAIVLGAQSWAVKLAKLEQVKVDGREPGELPGGLFRAQINPRSFLSYGYEPHGDARNVEIAVPVEGGTFYKAKAEGGSEVTFTSDDKVKKLLAGWEWPNDTENALGGAVWLQDEPMGRGHLIIFTSDPTARAMWPGLNKLLLNAILLGPAR